MNAVALAPAPDGAEAIRVLHQDQWLAVVDKPAGLMAHASAMARGEDDFLVDRLRAQFGRPVHLVHRLDRATSGCLLVAFDAGTAATLGATFMSRAVRKDYLAVCRGWPEWPDHELLLAMALDRQPAVRAPAHVGCVHLLRDHAFEMLVADARDELRTVAVDLVGETQRSLRG